MSSSVEDQRLRTFFHAAIHGKRAVKNSKDARNFLTALCSQQDCTRCVEDLISSSAGLQALGLSVRSSLSAEFLNEVVCRALKYLAHEDIRQLNNGILLGEIVTRIADPPTLWLELCRFFKEGTLTLDNRHPFSWLLLQILRLRSPDEHASVKEVARALTRPGGELLTSRDLTVRSVAYEIRAVLLADLQKQRVFGGEKPGGRHDNDFGDFQAISIFPTADEMASKQKPFYLSANAIEEIAPAQRGSAHLDNQFRLLREEMLSELRSDLLAARMPKTRNHRSLKLAGLTFDGLSTGRQLKRQQVSIKLRMKDHSSALQGKDYDERFHRLNEDRNLLRHDSFGCLSHGDEIVAFATLNREVGLLAQDDPILLLRLFDSPNIGEILIRLNTCEAQSLEFIHVDTPFFAFEPVLRSLQEKVRVPLASTLLGSNGSGDAETSSVVPAAVTREIMQREGLNLKALLKLPIDVWLDTPQSRSLIAGLSRSVSLIQGPPGTGKSFIGALLTKIFLDFTTETIVILCYTNHALDQFLEDIMNMGVPDRDIVRLGSKSTPATKHLGLWGQAQTHRRTQGQWDLLKLYSARLDVVADRLEQHSETFRRLGSSDQEMLDYLRYADDDLDFSGAFEVPSDTDGMTKVGPGSRALKSTYLISRWRSGEDRGVLQDGLEKDHAAVWQMSVEARRQSVRKWQHDMAWEQAQFVKNTLQEYNRAFEKHTAVRRENHANVIRSKRIIACTTTAAAMYRKELASVSAGVVVVEEAGEILESHILTAISDQTKNLVLIGDHKQLRPKVNNFDLTVEKGDGYDLNVSLFERLVLRGCPHTTLEEQHRMRPEISSLVRRITYPELRDSVKTLERPDIFGLQSNVVFVSHDHAETELGKVADRRDAGATVSRQNVFEAEMILKTVRYLAQQGYGSDRQVVLTPYLGQLRLLLEMLSTVCDPVLNDMDSYDLVRAGLLPVAVTSGKSKLRISTIDNYQGEESDIVIVSFTRGNPRGDVGFMSSPQRLNVLLSRARNGLIMFGNVKTFQASRKGGEMYASLFEQLKRDGRLYDGLPVLCPRHPAMTAMLRSKEDFDRYCPDGGCSEPCQALLACGQHRCPQKCHQIVDHTKVRCPEVIEIACTDGHKFKRRCSDNSKGCEICEAITKRKKVRQERDLQLDAERQRKLDTYTIRLTEIDEEIATERRAKQEMDDERIRANTITQRLEDLAFAKKHSSKEEPASCGVSGDEQSKTKADQKATPAQKLSSRRSLRTGSVAEQEWQLEKSKHSAQNRHLDELMAMIGLESIKREFLDIRAKIDTCIRQGLSVHDNRFGVSMLGNPGVGKTTVARAYASFLASLGALPGSKIEETTGAKLAAKGQQGCEKLIQDVLNAGGGAIFIDEAYQLTSGNNYGGGAVLDFLLTEVENLRGKIVFIVAGYRKPMETFFGHNPGLPSRFPLELQFADYNDEQLEHILQHQITKKFDGRMKLEEGLDGLYCRIIARRLGRSRGLEAFGNARAVENELARILTRQSKRITQERRSGTSPDDFVLTKTDLIGPEPSGVLEQSEIWKSLRGLIGLTAVKESIEALFNTLQTNYERELQEVPIIRFMLNRVFLGSPGTGKTTVAKLYGQILVELGFLSNGEVVVKNPSDFVGDVIGASEKATKAILSSTKGKVLIIDEAYGLCSSTTGSNPYATAIVDTIVAEVQSVPGDDRCVLLLGYKDQMETMFQNVNPGLSRRFPISDAFQFDDFSSVEMRHILDMKLERLGFHMTKQAQKVSMDVLDRARNRPNFGNAGEVDILLNAAQTRQQQRISKTRAKSSSTLLPEDVDPDFDRASKAATNVRLLFANEVGREGLISLLEGMMNTVKNMETLDLDPREQLPFNFQFCGPPGTGKTATARKMGKVYYDMGFLSTAEVVEVSATDLIGEYVGQTGPKTQKLLEKALGKVLFIDEAYRLANGRYAMEAMEELVDCLTKPAFAKKMVVILAGYDDDMERLMSVNPGLTSRFPETITFHALRPRECLALLIKQLKGKKGVGLSDAVENPSHQTTERFSRYFKQLATTKGWANARDVGLLAKTIYGDIMKSSKLIGKTLLITEEACDRAMDKLLLERQKMSRGTSNQPNLSAKAMSELLPPGAVESYLTSPPVYKSREGSPKASASSSILCDVSHDISDANTITIQRDPDVPLSVWADLERDKKAQDEREELLLESQTHLSTEKSTLATLESAQDTNLQNADSNHGNEEAVDEQWTCSQQAEKERIERVSRLRKQQQAVVELEQEIEKRKEAARRDQEVQRKLRTMGLCPAGFRWIRQTGGYRCAGGSHFASNAMLGLDV